MKPGPKICAQYLLEQVELDASPRDIVDALTDLAISKGWVSSHSEAREKAEKWKKATLNTLSIEIEKLQDLGRPARVAFNSSSEYFIQGVCFVEPRDDEAIRDGKLRRLRSEGYLRVLPTLSPEDFENLCGRFIEVLGVEAAQVTRRTADEGIDFYGRLSLESFLFPQDLNPTIQKQLSIWLVGQAKRYVEGQSGTPEIRDLVGAIALGRARAFGSSTDPFPDLEIRVADPVFAIFMTTGTLSSAAWRLLQRSGVIGMDGEMIAAFLADRGAGLTAHAFNEAQFISWIRAKGSGLF